MHSTINSFSRDLLGLAAHRWLSRSIGVLVLVGGCVSSCEPPGDGAELYECRGVQDQCIQYYRDFVSGASHCTYGPVPCSRPVRADSTHDAEETAAHHYPECQGYRCATSVSHTAMPLVEQSEPSDCHKLAIGATYLGTVHQIGDDNATSARLTLHRSNGGLLEGTSTIATAAGVSSGPWRFSRSCACRFRTTSLRSSASRG